MARMGNSIPSGPFRINNEKEERMKGHALALGFGAAALLTLGACNKDHKNAAGEPKAQTEKAAKVAGTKTIAAGLAPTSRFMAVAKAAGLDQTLGGPGPYTVFVPDDTAFNGAPPGTFDTKPQNRAQLTGVLTNLILSGTVLVADIDKTIDRGKGKGVLATMGGATLTATKEGGKTVLTDSAGHKATITGDDEIYTNGVVHHIDKVLMPSKAAAGPAVGQKAGN
jgi:uncharacterized surface protein with fasciclin (FAS1) repeats